MAEELMRVGRRYERLEATLRGVRAERRRLVLEALGAGLSEREAATLARCAPSYVHELSANGR